MACLACVLLGIVGWLYVINGHRHNQRTHSPRHSTPHPTPYTGKPLEETGVSLDNLKCMFKYVEANRVDFEAKLWNLKRCVFVGGGILYVSYMDSAGICRHACGLRFEAYHFTNRTHNLQPHPNPNKNEQPQRLVRRRPGGRHHGGDGPQQAPAGVRPLLPRRGGGGGACFLFFSFSFLWWAWWWIVMGGDVCSAGRAHVWEITY